jgi:DNA mismatch endonuclease, patch repair protein
VAVHERFSRQRTRDTAPEVALRRELHRRGLRYRLQVAILPDRRRRTDIVFGPSRVAVDIRGCWWHGCVEHRPPPKMNADWWTAKRNRNRDRDKETVQALERAGWYVIVVWEHDDVAHAADRVEQVVQLRRRNPSG